MAGDNKLSVSRVNPSASTAITFAAWDNNSWDVAARLVAERSRSLGAAVLAGAGGMFASADVAPAVNVAADLVEEPDAASISDTVAAARRAQLLLQAVVVPGEGTPEGQIIEAVTLPWYDIIDAILRDPDTVYEISPRKWEEIIAGAYERAGFDKVTLTPHSGDLGRDVIAIKKGLGEVRVIDQVKAFKPPHLVTAHDVQALMGVLQTDGAAKGFPVSCASAADMVLKAPPAPAYSAPGYNWTGFYIGGNFGGGWGNESYSLTGTNALGTLVGGGSADPSGVYGGGQIGVNYEFPSHWVVGIEADGDWSNISGSTSGCGTYTTGVDAGLPSGCSTSNSKLQDFGTVRGRLGYAWNNVLLYGTGGWAWGNASSTSALNCIGTACPATSLPFTGGTSSYSNTLSGWAAGAGLEWGFLPHWTARVEYLHLEFDDVVSSYSATELIAIPGVGPTTSTTMYGARSNTGIDTVRVGLNYLFNY